MEQNSILDHTQQNNEKSEVYTELSSEESNSQEGYQNSKGNIIDMLTYEGVNTGSDPYVNTEYEKKPNPLQSIA